jgi:hypothetical protein
MIIIGRTRPSVAERMALRLTLERHGESYVRELIDSPPPKATRPGSGSEEATA